jgi:chaperone modulatory protein CbpM
MELQLTESIWMDESGVCGIEHLAELSGLSQDELRDLVENGVIEPADAGAKPPVFFLRTIVTAKTARRLRDDFELDRHGLALALTLLKRIQALEEKLQSRY